MERGIEVRLDVAASGVFEVLADGVVIFSKQRTRRFPKAGEIIAALRALD